MEPHTDEPLDNGTRARNRKGLLSRKGVHRPSVGAVALSIVTLLSGCPSLASLDEKPIDRLMTGGVVIALRLGGTEASAALPGGTGDNWIVLFDFQGRGQAGHVECGERGDIVQTESGVSYGIQAEDFLTTQEGTQQVPRVGDRSVEYFRPALPDGRIEVISAARGSGICADIIECDGTMMSVRTDDKLGGFGLCGSRVLTIMNTEASRSMRSAAFEVYAAQSGGEGSGLEDFSVVAQLGDPAGVTLRILAVAPMIPGLRSVQHSYACEGNSLTAPSIQVDDPIGAREGSVVTARGTPVFQYQDPLTGQRSVSPVLDEAGNAIHLNEDLDTYGDKAILAGDEYRLISRHGHTFSINLMNGQGRHLFSTPERVEQGDMVFQVTESGVYFLTDSSREYAVTLSYHPWDGDDSRVILSTGSLESYLRVRELFSGDQRAIESFTLRPGRDGGVQWHMQTRMETTMSTHNGGKRETGADEQEQGSSKRPKCSRRWAFLMLALPTALLAWSCALKAPLPVMLTSKLVIEDVIIAVQLGEAQSQSGLGVPIQDNLVALVDVHGEQGIVRIGNQWEGRILWSDRGISFGAGQWEYQTTENGTSSQETKGWRVSNVQRYELSDGWSIMVSYEMDLGYRVDTIEFDGSAMSVSTPGTHGDTGQCGNRILSIVDTKQLWCRKQEAFEAYAVQSGDDGTQSEELSAVVQLNDHDGDTPHPAGVAPMIDGLVSGQREFAYEGDMIMMPSVQTSDSRDVRVTADGGETGTVVLKRWGLLAGQRMIIPVVDKQGNPIETDREHSIFGHRGIRVDDEYRLISEGGDAFAMDLRSGRGRFLFSYGGTRINQRMVYQISETGVYVLEGRREDHNVIPSYRPWDGGAHRGIITMDKLADYVQLEGDILLSGHWRRIQPFPLRPGWDGGAQ